MELQAGDIVCRVTIEGTYNVKEALRVLGTSGSDYVCEPVFPKPFSSSREFIYKSSPYVVKVNPFEFRIEEFEEFYDENT